MKKTIAFIVLGSLGVLQYVYFQFTPLAFNYSYKVVPDSEYGKFGLMTLETTVTRDWTAGIIGALIGIVLLCLGIIQLRRKRQHTSEIK
jgi:hypothetical protein